MLSAVIITKNNILSIGKTLDSLRWCDEIVVVDSGSTDGTKDICIASGCRVIDHAFEGFGRQKHFAVSQATHSWVFVIDSDEVCTPELALEIQQKAGKEINTAYRIPRSLVFMGKRLRYGGESKKSHLRLFDKTKGQYNFDEVHEDVVMIAGETKELTQLLLHDSYLNLHHYLEKLNDYTSKGAEKLYQKNKTLHPIIIAVRLPLDFIRLYILRGLFLDGFPGFCWAALSSFSPFIKYMKLREIYRSSGK
jgi:glycosyltransferase involved in cell wall biosynthesis